MSMFETYSTIPSNHIPHNNENPSILTKKPRKPMVAYNAAGEPIGLMWNRGDTICLEFSTTGDVVYEEGDLGEDIPYGAVEDAETYLSGEGKVLQVNLYSFRYNLLASVELPATTKLVVSSRDLKMEELRCGTYKLQLNLIDKNQNITHTLIRSDECQIFIR